MFQLRQTGCCGVYEMEDISSKPTSAAVIDGILEILYNYTGAWMYKTPFITYTSVVARVRSDHASQYGGRTDDYGTDLADYIEQNDLGTVDRTVEPRVSHTGNTLKIWIWNPNYATLAERLRTQRNAIYNTPEVATV